MNSLSESIVTGAVGELLVQLRLFQYGVQAAPPLQDSGNDLIGVRGHTFKAVQVKATRKDWGWNLTKIRRQAESRLYHLLALVQLDGTDNELFLDDCDIFLMCQERFLKYELEGLEDCRLNQALVDIFWPPPDEERAEAHRAAEV